MNELADRETAPDARAAIRAPIGAHLPYRGTRVIERPGWYQLVTPGSHAIGGNEVVFSPGDADVDEVVAGYAAAGVPRFKWCVWPGAEALEAQLAARGFERWEARAMVVEANALRLAVPAGMNVEEVTAPDGRFAAYLATVAEGWELAAAERDELARCLACVLAEAGRRHRFHVAWCDGAAVGTGGFVVQSELDAIYLTGGVVLPAYRGRGIYRALIAARVAEAAAAGAQFVVTHARSHTSAPILERLGFRTAAAYRVFLSP